MCYYEYEQKYPRIGINIPYEKLTKVRGDHTRHIEQLWDEIHKLKEEIKRFKNEHKKSTQRSLFS